MYKLVLLRHGESEWNLENRFTGWTDVNLTSKGVSEASSAGKRLNINGFRFDIVYTSVLKRAINTMKICLDKMEMKNTTINYDWRLNERHYGKLQGLNKSETVKKFGDEQVLIWRRSYDIPPPEMEKDDKRHSRFDKKYLKLKPSQIPDSESLKATKKRFMPLWNKSIKPNIFSGKNILIVAHGNSLRALVKHLEKLTNKEIIKLNIPTGIPLIYELDYQLNPIKHYYLDNQKNIA